MAGMRERYGRPWKEVRDTIQAKRSQYARLDEEWYAEIEAEREAEKEAAKAAKRREPEGCFAKNCERA